jgi:hypothetical protein
LRLCKSLFAAIFFHSGKADNYSAIRAVVIGLFVFQLFSIACDGAPTLLSAGFQMHADSNVRAPNRNQWGRTDAD